MDVYRYVYIVHSHVGSGGINIDLETAYSPLIGTPSKGAPL